MRKGKLYHVTCNQLGLPRELWTKDGSFLAANAYWDRLVGQERLSEAERRLNWAREHDEEVAQELARLKQEGTDEDEDMASFTIDLLREQGWTIEAPDRPDPAVVREVFGNARIWQERYSRQEQVAQTQTLATSITEFLAILVRRQKARSFADCKQFFQALPSYPGFSPRMACQDIDESKVTKVYQALANADLAPATKAKRWGFFKRFVTFLHEQNRLTLPRNLHSGLFVFKVQPQAINTYPLPLIQETLAALPERLKLYALLGLNCGMTNIDIGSLRQEQVKDGYLTRKRVKTDRSSNVPLVRYRLWQETQRLLEKSRAAGSLVLTTANGQPLVENRLVNAKPVIKDMIQQHWRRWRRKNNCPMLLKEFRSIAASMLDNHKDYGRYVSYFLGHSPKGLKDRHYAIPSQSVFDEAIAWLGRQFGQ